MAVTRWSSQLKPTEASAKYAELPLPWQVIIQSYSTKDAAGAASMLGTGNCKSIVGEANSSGLGGIAPASGDEIDFLVKLPNDFDTTAAAYLDIYYQTIASATKGDEVAWTVTYNAVNPNASTQAVADATSTSGITNPTTRTLATGVSETFLFRDSATIAASTLTAGYGVHAQLTAGGTYAEGEVIIENIILRYVKLWM
jgi:hypothetical protein